MFKAERRWNERQSHARYWHDPMDYSAQLEYNTRSPVFPSPGRIGKKWHKPWVDRLHILGAREKKHLLSLPSLAFGCLGSFGKRQASLRRAAEGEGRSAPSRLFPCLASASLLSLKICSSFLLAQHFFFCKCCLSLFACKILPFRKNISY